MYLQIILALFGKAAGPQQRRESFLKTDALELWWVGVALRLKRVLDEQKPGEAEHLTDTCSCLAKQTQRTTGEKWN